MSQNLCINAVTDNLVQVLTSTLRTSYDATTDVQESSKQDFSEDGQLVLRKIAVRVRFGQEECGPTRDITRTTYTSSLSYQIVCRHESLRSKAETRSRSLQLVSAAKAILAGTRLLLPDGTQTDGILLQGVFPVSDQFGPVDECYGIAIEVTGVTQYPGDYIVPGSALNEEGDQ
jgi:hypothetical protein